MRRGYGSHLRIFTAAITVASALVIMPLENVAFADDGVIALGGKLYDQWFKVTKAPKPEDTHMSWPASNTGKKGNVTHRCKSCHGWDYMGKDGAYSSGSYKTGIAGLRNHDGGDPAKVVAVLNDSVHGYSGKMDAATMEAIAMFVTKGQVDMNASIDRPTKKAKGDAATGKNYYATLCVNCHGVDGKLPKDMPALGGLANDNPWEILHKILNGQPGEAMPALRALPMQVSVDVLSYLQTLPKE